MEIVKSNIDYILKLPNQEDFKDYRIHMNKADGDLACIDIPKDASLVSSDSSFKMNNFRNGDGVFWPSFFGVSCVAPWPCAVPEPTILKGF